MTADHAERVQAFLDAWRHYDNNDPIAIEYQPGTRRTTPIQLTVTDVAAVLDELKQLRQDRARYRIAWRMARQRAKVASWAADKYGSRVATMHSAMLAMLEENLALKLFGPETVAASEQQPVPIEIGSFAELCDVVERLGYTFTGELRPLDVAPQQPEHDGGN